MNDPNDVTSSQPLEFPRNPALSVNANGSGDAVTKSLGTNFIWPPLNMDNQPPPLVTAINRATESCMFKATFAGIAGGGLGLAFGLFFGGYANAVDKAVDMQGSTLVKFRVGMREAWRAMASYSKNFARFGFLFSGCECAIEKFRGRHDIINSTLGGCAAGAAMGSAPMQSIPYRARAAQMTFGCVSVGAFSAAIDYYMEYMD